MPPENLRARRPATPKGGATPNRGKLQNVVLLVAAALGGKRTGGEAVAADEAAFLALVLHERKADRFRMIAPCHFKPFHGMACFRRT